MRVHTYYKMNQEVLCFFVLCNLLGVVVTLRLAGHVTPNGPREILWQEIKSESLKMLSVAMYHQNVNVLNPITLSYS